MRGYGYLPDPPLTEDGFALGLRAICNMAAKMLPAAVRLRVLDGFCEELRGEIIHQQVEDGGYGE